MGQNNAAPSRLPWLIFAALSLIWGSTWIAADSFAEQVPPLFSGAARLSLSAVFLLPFVLLKRRKFPSGRSLFAVVLLSVTMIVLPLLLLLWARPQLPSATVMVLFATMPLVVILLTPIADGGDVPPRALQASVAGLGGLVLATGASFSAAQAGAAAIVFLAVFSTGAASLIAKCLCRQVDALTLSVCVLGVAGALLSVAALVLERGRLIEWNRPSLTALLLLSAVGGAPAYAAWFWFLQRRTAYEAVTVQWMEPLVAVAESAWILHMGLSFNMLAGSVITFISLIVLARSRVEDDQGVSLLGNRDGKQTN